MSKSTKPNTFLRVRRMITTPASKKPLHLVNKHLLFKESYEEEIIYLIIDTSECPSAIVKFPHEVY